MHECVCVECVCVCCTLVSPAHAHTAVPVSHVPRPVQGATCTVPELRATHKLTFAGKPGAGLFQSVVHGKTCNCACPPGTHGRSFKTEPKEKKKVLSRPPGGRGAVGGRLEPAPRGTSREGPAATDVGPSVRGAEGQLA